MNVSDGDPSRQPGPPKFTLHPVLVLTAVTGVGVSGATWAMLRPDMAAVAGIVVTVLLMALDLIRQL